MKKTYRIKTNNQEQLPRKQNESDATSWWIEFQKTRLWRWIQDKHLPVIILLPIVNGGPIRRKNPKGNKEDFDEDV